MYILLLLQFKLKRMEKRFRGPKCLVLDSEILADEMLEAIELIDLIHKDEFVGEEWDAWEKKWGPIRFGEKETISDEDIKLRSEDLHTIAMLEEERTQAAHDKLFTQLAERMRAWWD
jgi:hypothetical protein